MVRFYDSTGRELTADEFASKLMPAMVIGAKAENTEELRRIKSKVFGLVSIGSASAYFILGNILHLARPAPLIVLALVIVFGISSLGYYLLSKPKPKDAATKKKETEQLLADAGITVR